MPWWRVATPVLLVGAFVVAASAGRVIEAIMIDSGGDVVEVTDVRDNVFYAPDPPEDVKAVVALDDKREVIWRGLEAQSPAE